MSYSNKTHVILLRNDKGEWEVNTDKVRIIFSDPDDPDSKLVHFFNANKNGQTIFSYSKKNVVKLENPEIFNPNEYDFWHADQKLKDLYIACKFTDTEKICTEIYWSFSFKDSNKPDVVYEGNEVEKRKKPVCTRLNDPGEYLRTMAYFLGYPIKSKATREIVLAREMEKTLASEKKPLYDAFLNPSRFTNSISETIPPLIFPYGINSSQLTAVKNAFSSKVSIIQGPPGTGKTQTILNILANIVIQGKTVLVVAGANSAIDNILEKLEEKPNNISFIAARLGRLEKRKEFFSSIKGGKINCPPKWDINVPLNTIGPLVDELAPLLDKNIEYYTKLHSDDVNERSGCIQLEQDLEAHGFSEKVSKLSELSMLKLKAYLYMQYNGTPRSKFSEKDLSNTEGCLRFQEEYPIVLSTTYSATCSKASNTLFDYVIFDEASQIDIVSGLLAFSCAKNAVIVGDSKQLPNVISKPNKRITDAIFSFYDIDKRFNYSEYSFLEAIKLAFGDEKKGGKSTLLKEHYRCHPKIARFFNDRFYNGELVIMRKPDDRKDVLMLRRTVPGNHAYNHINHREEEEIEEIKQNHYITCQSEEIGIITPYNNQVDRIDYDKDIEEDILVSTVHKFQGRQKKTIFISTVDNEYHKPTKDDDEAFVNNENLINVSVSRAVDKLILVTNGNKGNSGLVQELAEYIEKEDGIVEDGQIQSQFDRMHYESEPDITFPSDVWDPSKDTGGAPNFAEKIAYELICEVLKEDEFQNIKVKFQYPLKDVVPMDRRESLSTNECQNEKSFVENTDSHIDFLFFKGEQKIMALEIDGETYHERGSKQYCRDIMKDRIMWDVCQIPLFRMRSKESVNEKEYLCKYLRFGLYLQQLQESNIPFTLHVSISEFLSKEEAKKLNPEQQNKIYSKKMYVYCLLQEKDGPEEGEEVAIELFEDLVKRNILENHCNIKMEVIPGC